jgi:transcriptional regulator with XRE-family HTH domain
MAHEVLKLRKLAGWTQTRLAAVVDMHVPRLSGIENGEITPEPDELIALKEPLLKVIARRREELSAVLSSVGGAL